MEKQKDVDVLLSEIQENNPRQFDRLALILDRERKAKATKDAMYMVTTKAIKNDKGMTISQILIRSIFTTNIVSPPPLMIPMFVGI